jgi:hypothetical protein
MSVSRAVEADAWRNFEQNAASLDNPLSVLDRVPLKVGGN